LIKQPHWQGWKSEENFNRLIFAVKIRMASGDCLIASPTKETGSDSIQLIFDVVKMIDQNKRFASTRVDPELRTLEIRQGEQLLARSVDIESTELSTPIFYFPGGYGMNIDSWQFARRNRSSAEPINSIGRLVSLSGWSIKFPVSGIKDT
jgi:hypothetical protein